MQVWHGLDDVPADRADWSGGAAVTIGVFDGVHRGHQHVVRRMVDAARQRGLLPVVVTFEPHPLAVVRPDARPDNLTTIARRAALLGAAGAEGVLVLPFTAELSRLSAEDFVGQVLVTGLGVRHVVVGANFRFGHRAAGDVTLLSALGERHGFTVDAAPMARGEATWSSTYVRERLAEGDVTAAAEALGRPHRVEGPVVEGDKRGRQLGYPTANLELPAYTAIPADGVYAGLLVRFDADREEPLPAAVSVGTNPTFDGTVRRVEAYALDRDDLELYGEHVGVDVVRRLRPTLRFDAVSELVARMAADVVECRAVLDRSGFS